MATFLGKSVSAIREFHPQGTDVNLPQETTTIFVGDLSIFVGENDLLLAFQPYGTILDIKIMRCEETHKNLSYGFVKFLDAYSAANAMEALNGQLLGGRPLRISWATHKDRKPDDQNNTMPKPNRPLVDSAQFIDSSSLHVTFSSDQLTFFIDEIALRNVFSTFGDVLDVSIKKYDYDISHGTQRGYGFVHFSSDDNGVAAALKSIEELRNTLVGAVRYKCDISHKLFMELYQRSHPAIPSLLQRYPSFLKFVANKEKAREKRKTLTYNQPAKVANNLPDSGILPEAHSVDQEDTALSLQCRDYPTIDQRIYPQFSFLPHMMMSPMPMSFNISSPFGHTLQPYTFSESGTMSEMSDMQSTCVPIDMSTSMGSLGFSAPLVVGDYTQSVSQSSSLSPSSFSVAHATVGKIVDKSSHGASASSADNETAVPSQMGAESATIPIQQHPPVQSFWNPWSPVLFPFAPFSVPLSPTSPMFAFPPSGSFISGFPSNPGSRRGSFSSQSKERGKQRWGRFSFIETHCNEAPS